MKRINGEYYKKERFAGGKKYWVHVSEREVVEQQAYWLAVVLMPTVWIVILAAAAGLI